ncbi:MAG: hypothetical protein J6S79_04600 [Lachnospiraceae bacterium]|nr:hypothetical protein [Lachnospiraceae bacterium]
MATINVYKQYFEAKGTFNGVPRRGALVMLISDSCEGRIRYDTAVSFFAHRDEEDFAVSYDAFFEKTLYEGKGRRSKKREQALMAELQDIINAISAEQNAEVLWEKPLREAERG